MSRLASVVRRPGRVLKFAVSVLTVSNSVYASALCSSLVLGNTYIVNGRKAVTDKARPVIRLCIMHPEAVQSTTDRHYMRSPRVPRTAAIRWELERPRRVDTAARHDALRAAVAHRSFGITWRGRQARPAKDAMRATSLIDAISATSLLDAMPAISMLDAMPVPMRCKPTCPYYAGS
jgi:hypothetical protein